MVQVVRLETLVLQEPEAQPQRGQFDGGLLWNSNWFKRGKTWRLPLSQQEVVGLDVGVDDVDAVQLLHRVQDTDGEVHDERLRHQLVTQGLIDVHGILGGESECQDTEDETCSCVTKYIRRVTI